MFHEACDVRSEKQLHANDEEKEEAMGSDHVMMRTATFRTRFCDDCVRVRYSLTVWVESKYSIVVKTQIIINIGPFCNF